MKVKIYNQNGKSAGEHDVRLRDDFKGTSSQVIHDVITGYRAAQRSGTACTKTVAEVVGSGKKPWRQKGTGRARAGLARSPIWRKGGVVFGPKPRSYRKDLARGLKKMAFEQALSKRIQDGDVIVLESMDVKSPKTKEFLGVLKELKIDGKTLLIHDAPSTNLQLATRNLSWVRTAPVNSVNTYQLLDCDKVILTRAALDLLAARQGSKNGGKSV